ncbi:hypothetical protein GLW08_20360 [Pontibacillus yanchengensis]|uniref:Uncharacterized protein n=2 Tax=Pontibacillus yanchengensis TaxID=462910 RepID=A0ACC7VMK6_9BACI|nr:JAB domain-containing protein [Pontibacillus yanchengensis]MYL35459.1 hypothetical protein [Pontibacillus yanchengensis]MYL55659.1 hypothetical protein [Pontibacillus yanchengensis]
MYTFRKEPLLRKPILEEPNDVITYVSSSFRDTDEHFTCLFMNNKGQVLNAKMISRSTVDYDDISLQEIYGTAKEENAYGVITVHNKPQQGREVLGQFKSFLEKMMKAKDTFSAETSVDFIDHIVIDESYHSVQEMGWA